MESKLETLYVNKDATIGVVIGLEGATDLGYFSVKLLQEWLQQVKNVLGDDEVDIQFKMSDSNPAFMIAAYSVDEKDAAVVVGGKYRVDGKKWGEE
jgi:hypothetical protein